MDDLVLILILIPILFLVSSYIYFLPSIIGYIRGVRNLGSIMVLNFFLGWTLIGWAVALAMAFATVDKD